MVDLFEPSTDKAQSEKKRYPSSIEIFARKKGRALKRYGTKKPIEKTNKQELLTAWREDM